MSREVRRRTSLGFWLPVIATLVVGAIVFALSRIFLAVPEAAAPWVALLFAANVLIGCAVAAAVPGRRSFAFLGMVLVATIVAGGVAGAVVGPRPIEPHHAAHPEEPTPTPAPTAAPTPADTPTPDEPTPPPDEPPAKAVGVVAQDIAFDTDTLELPPGEVTIRFENRDAAPHNISIYTAPGGDVLFEGEIFPGPDTRDYTFQAPPPGEYYFQCDVHPNMNGTVRVG